MEFLEWKYQRNNSMLKRHHVYICPKCDREVEVKENSLQEIILQ